jgi:succinyl-CoA synthetase alpha subunit
VSGNQGTAGSKVKAFEAAGIPVANAPSEIPALVKTALRS